MFHSQQVFCEARQCSLHIKAPQFSWLWIIAFFSNVTNCSIIFENNEMRFFRSLFGAFGWDPETQLRPTKTEITDSIGIRPYYFFSLSHPEDIVSFLCSEAENPSTTDNSLSFHQSWVGGLAASVVQHKTPSFQRASLLVNQHSQGKR